MWRWFLSRMQKFLGFERVHELAIKRSVIEDVSYMAANAHPKEMLAFLSATQGNVKGTVIIDEIQLQAYHAELDHVNFQLYQLPTHTNIIGTVHSHPGSSTRPSDADLRLFSQYGLVHAVISEPYKERNMAFYDKKGEKIYVKLVE